MRLSYSALDTFKLCPAKYKYQYIDRIPAPKSKEAIFGTLIHSALKLLHDPTPIISATEEDILNFWSNNWDPSIYSDPREEAAAFAQGVAILKNYYAKNFPGQFNVAALETPFEAPIMIGKDLHILAGKIDRVDKIEDDMFEVIDYKTAKKMPSQKNVDNDLQLAVYHLGIANRWPSIKEQNRPVKTSLYFLKHGEKLSSIKNAEDLEIGRENIIGLIENVLEAYRKEKFDPIPNPLCPWCAYQRICPVWKHKFVEKKIFFNDQDVSSLINDYISLKDEIDERNKKMGQIKDTFSRFMDQEKMERLFSESGYVGRQLIQRFKYDSSLLRGILEPAGKWNEVLKIDETKLKKVARELSPDLRQKIAQARKLEKEYKTFSISKTKKSKFDKIK
jgi:RecB family exonuclease